MHISYSYTRCAFGVAVRDVTPPIGIYARSWGAAIHEVAEGVHRPFTATAALFAPLDGAGSAAEAGLLALVALDTGWFQYLPDEQAMRAAIARRCGLGPESLLINMSHTHAGASVNSQLADQPGGELIPPYLEQLADRIGAALEEARATLAPAWISYGSGRCALAANRDFWDAEAARYACGYNPGAPADDTLLVARVTGDGGETRATLFNYACHPTTLAWRNRLLSPDYIGAAREILERAFGAPVLFLQGASGELGPRESYVGEPAVADRNGRQLGYAAAAALEGLPPPATCFVYTGIVASGANLGTWEYQPIDAEQQRASARLVARMAYVDLPRKETPAVVVGRAGASPDSVEEREKARRRRFIEQALGDAPVHRMPIWLWRLGDAALIAVPNELYSLFQQTLRQRLPERPLLVLGLTNGSMGYLPPQETYGVGLYQEQQSPYAPGCLERTIDVAGQELDGLFQEGPL